MKFAGPAVVAFATFASGLLLMWGTGASGDPRDYLPRDSPIGLSAFTTVATANCTQWNNAAGGRRPEVGDALGRHFGHKSDFFAGARMPDADAYRIIDRACGKPEARRIRLYKIYGRALAFRGFR